MDREIIERIKRATSLLDVASKIASIDRSRIRSGRYRGHCPLGHSSASGTCCIITDEFFHCFNCLEGGDCIRFVQLIKFGGVSAPTFLPALEYLAELAGITFPKLSSKDVAEALEEFKEAQRLYAVLTASCSILHEQLTAEDSEFFRKRYGLSQRTLEQFKIGYSDGRTLLPALRSLGYSDHDALITGLFRLGPAGPEEFFAGRYVFPYWRNGKVVYAIGRKTEKTPKFPWEESKYKKLPTWSDSRSYIAKALRNDHIFNIESALKSDEVIITEGITDALILHQHGFPVISPVTVQFSKADQERVVRVLRKDQLIYVANDNDPNGAGQRGGLAMAKFLSRNGFTVKIITLPLTERHHDARRKLAALEG